MKCSSKKQDMLKNWPSVRNLAKHMLFYFSWFISYASGSRLILDCLEFACELQPQLQRSSLGTRRKYQKQLKKYAPYRSPRQYKSHTVFRCSWASTSICNLKTTNFATTFYVNLKFTFVYERIIKKLLFNIQ